MATVVYNPEAFVNGYEVAFESEVLIGPGAYVWDAVSGVGTLVYLFGSGITSNGTAPTGGTIDEIRIDLGGDSFLGINNIEMTITGISVPLVDLAGNRDVFWETAFQENDTISISSPAQAGSEIYGDGHFYAGSAGTIMSDDTIDATGTLGRDFLYGDYRNLEDAAVIAGDDSLICAGATGGVTAVGDIYHILARHADVSVIGGDDTIEIACTGDTIQYLIGDVMSVNTAYDPEIGALVTGGDDTISNAGPGGGRTIYIAGDVYEAEHNESNVLTIVGGDDEISGSDSGELIAGDVYNLIGGAVTGGNDLIEAGGGDDDIAGDVLVHTGGTFTGGDDIIDGGLGNDTIDGQGGNDWVQFLSNDIGVVVALAAGGVDGSAEGQGSDIIRGIENVAASEEYDTVTGNGAANMVLAAGGDDRVSGRGGADYLLGLDGSDTLTGGGGADTIKGGGGADELTGSSGADIFFYGSASDTGFTLPNRDVIEDFAHLVDQIDVDALDAQTGTIGTQDFDFIGTDEFSAEGQIRVFQNGADTEVRINATGADSYETAIILRNTIAADITVDDFIL